MICVRRSAWAELLSDIWLRDVPEAGDGYPCCVNGVDGVVTHSASQARHHARK
ncbi:MULTISPECIES: hypothetical protein [unclassified Corynebacterium]|uniref:hypothetical protein n=1 Tax=unclassified Corynebacterium TaxID=2624378 RepID=UPI003524FC44